MNDIQKEFLETLQFRSKGTKTVDYAFDKTIVIGTPVKVMRSGKDEPDEGWHIVEVYFPDELNKLKKTFVKVRKADKEDPQKGLEKKVRLQSLIKLNPEIKSLLSDS